MQNYIFFLATDSPVLQWSKKLKLNNFSQKTQTWEYSAHKINIQIEL